MRKITVCITLISLLVTASLFAQEKLDRAERFLGPPLAPGEKALNLTRMDNLGVNSANSPAALTMTSDDANTLYVYIPIRLPVGSTIKRIEMYAEDNSTDNIKVTLRSISQAQVDKQWAFFSSFGNSAGVRYFASSSLNVEIKLWYELYVRFVMPAAGVNDDRIIHFVRVVYVPSP